MSKKTIEVPVEWINGLIEKAKKVDEWKVFDFGFRDDLHLLLGYIESAKNLFK